jgi:hypothetical protein
MAVTVEIKTGQRRIIDYIFSPLVEVASTAMKGSGDQLGAISRGGAMSASSPQNVSHLSCRPFSTASSADTASVEYIRDGSQR